MDGYAGFGGDVAGMVVVFLWYGRWWYFGIDSRALLQSAKPGGRGVVWVCLKMGMLSL